MAASLVTRRPMPPEPDQAQGRGRSSPGRRRRRWRRGRGGRAGARPARPAASRASVPVIGRGGQRGREPVHTHVDECLQMLCEAREISWFLPRPYDHPDDPVPGVAVKPVAPWATGTKPCSMRYSRSVGGRRLLIGPPLPAGLPAGAVFLRWPAPWPGRLGRPSRRRTGACPAGRMRAATSSPGLRANWGGAGVSVPAAIVMDDRPKGLPGAGELVGLGCAPGPSARPAVTRSVTAGRPGHLGEGQAPASPRPPPPAAAAEPRDEARRLVSAVIRRGSRAAADGADLPYRTTLAVSRAGRLVRLAFRPGPAASTLDSARRVKSGPARTGPGDGLRRNGRSGAQPRSSQAAASGAGGPPDAQECMRRAVMTAAPRKNADDSRGGSPAPARFLVTVAGAGFMGGVAARTAPPCTRRRGRTGLARARCCARTGAALMRRPACHREAGPEWRRRR